MIKWLTSLLAVFSCGHVPARRVVVLDYNWSCCVTDFRFRHASLLWMGTPKQSLFARPPITTPSACPPLARIICTQGIRSVANLLWHLPAGMVDRRQVSRVAGLVEGEIATVLLKVRSLARSLAVSTLFRALPTCI